MKTIVTVNFKQILNLKNYGYGYEYGEVFTPDHPDAWGTYHNLTKIHHQFLIYPYMVHSISYCNEDEYKPTILDVNSNIDRIKKELEIILNPYGCKFINAFALNTTVDRSNDKYIENLGDWECCFQINNRLTTCKLKDLKIPVEVELSRFVY